MQIVVNGTGRRKTSVARVYVKDGQGHFIINNRQIDNFFHRELDRNIAKSPLSLLSAENSIDIKVRTTGGGCSGQSSAVRLGLSRALLKRDPSLKEVLRYNGWLTRDSRMVERKKPGHVKARKVQQFKKR